MQLDDLHWICLIKLHLCLHSVLVGVEYLVIQILRNDCGIGLPYSWQIGHFFISFTAIAMLLPLYFPLLHSGQSRMSSTRSYRTLRLANFRNSFPSFCETICPKFSFDVFNKSRRCCRFAVGISYIVVLTTKRSIGFEP